MNLDSLSLTVNEAAYLAEVIWRAPFVDLFPLTGIVRVNPGDPAKATLLSYPENWGLDEERLATKLGKLSEDEQRELARRFAALDELDENRRSRLSETLDDWIRQRSEAESREALREVFVERGIPIEQPTA